MVVYLFDAFEHDGSCFPVIVVKHIFLHFTFFVLNYLLAFTVQLKISDKSTQDIKRFKMLTLQNCAQCRYILAMVSLR